MLSCLALIWFLTKNTEANQLRLGLLTMLCTAIAVWLGVRFFYQLQMQNIRQKLYQTFQTLESFDTDEFTASPVEKRAFKTINELNDYLQDLIRRLQEHYQANKQFTANAAHELQTPLAIIKGNIELLIQSPRLGKKEMEALGIILNNTNRLARLNAALILLSKIQNKRFSDLEKVDIIKVVEEVLENFKDLIQVQELEIQKKYAPPLTVNMSATLAEILVANLIQNAIRHNTEKGWIKIEIQQRTLRISNPGKFLEVEPASLFKRFKRDTDIEESLGLGLSIVKRICDQYQHGLRYLHEKGIHTLEVNF